jgi:ABC-type lipoprotein release transport system permease subunit
MIEIFLAIRSLILRRKRYRLMAVAIILGFTMISFIHSAAFGVMETVKIKAARYFSGHISLTGYLWDNPLIEDPESLLSSLENMDLPIRTIAPRTIYYKSDASLFFAGESIRQRRLVGIDFEAEKDEFSGLSFLEGSLDNMLSNGDDGVLISKAAADTLGTRVGDDVTIFITLNSGQYNTKTLYVQGIFNETSLFGYVAYMKRIDLNELLLWEPYLATDIAIYADEGEDIDELANEIGLKLNDDIRVLPPMSSKTSLYEELAKVDYEQGAVLAPLTLNAHLAQLTDILDAFLIVSWFVLILFILIVMVGILNTYRVLVYERTKEIGTLRALGMSRKSIRLLFVYEAFMLAIVSSVIGFILSLGLVEIFNFINMDFFPGAGLFTENGLLKPYLNIKMSWINLILMSFAVVLAALGPANKAARIMPAEALRTGK